MVDYRHPYPDDALAENHPFIEHQHRILAPDAMQREARGFLEEMDRRRSVRMFSDEPVDRDLIEMAIATASTAPSGAHKQPWTFVAISNPTLKRQIREAAEEEERVNYLGNRLNAEWREALAPLGTDHHKEFLEIAPWIIVLFEQRHEVRLDGSTRHNYYVKESCGIAAGLFIAAVHRMGLATLPHTPSPMAFLRRILRRPDNERPFVMFPVGHPLPGVLVPDLQRKPLDAVASFIE